MAYKTTKITNPHYLGLLGKRILKITEYLKPISITYETLYTYFTTSIQKGGDKTQFIIVFDEEIPIGFMHCFVRGLPYTGTVYCDYLYAWGKQKDATRLLIDEFIEFGKKNRSPIYEIDVYNEKMTKTVEKLSKELKASIKLTNKSNFVGRL